MILMQTSDDHTVSHCSEFIIKIL